MPSPAAIDYGPGFSPPELSCGLAMVPHGKTPSNEKLLFQSHADGGPNQTLTPEGVAMAQAGAAAFVEEFGQVLHARPEHWVLYRSPLGRTAATAEAYLAALRDAGLRAPEVIVDPDLIEIDAGSWHGLTVEGLAAAGRPAEAAAAAEYRAGSFVAKPADGSGGSLLEMLARVSGWLKTLEARHGAGRTNVLVFGHGTFQNSAEVLLRSYPEKSPAQVFSRISGGSHLRRGECHVLSPLRG